MSIKMRRRHLGGPAGAVLLIGVAAGAAGAADGRLYPSGPPNGVAYLRFANLAPQAVTVTSPAAKLALPADAGHRVREFDPVNPGSALTGSVQLGGGSKPMDLKLAQNEFATVAVSGSEAEGPTLTVFRETPNDFNAQKASLGLFNLDMECKQALLAAGDAHQTVIEGVAPGAVGRRAVNPVAVSLSISCGDSSASMPVALEPLAAGERYSIFVVAGPGGRQAVAVHDEQAPLRP